MAPATRRGLLGSRAPCFQRPPTGSTPQNTSEQVQCTTRGPRAFASGLGQAWLMVVTWLTLAAH